MEQRSLRLGDIVDDYCPRERRITNHVIVALVGNDIRQTRCSTCEVEHEFKGARAPRKKMKSDGSSDLAGGVLVPAKSATNGQTSVPAAAPPEPVVASEAPTATAETNGAAPDAPAQTEPVHDGWLAHRPLIRASLPRVEGEVPPPRPIPEFTMHQRQGRGFGGGRPFRHGSSGHGGNGQSFRDDEGPNGNRAPGAPGLPGGGKPGRHRRRRRRR